MTKLSTTVADIMSRNVLVVHVNRSLSEAWRLFFELNVHHLPVVDESERLIGILSTNDILKKLAFQLPTLGTINEKMIDTHFTIFDLMTPDPIRIRPRHSIQDSARLFTERHISALPVTENEKIVGIITTGDVIKELASDKKKPLSIGSFSIF
jgi:acetoin utilization protein AcuB